MLSTIFQPEVSTLESQVAALQAQIAAHTARISLLNETELLAGGTLEALKGAIEKVSSLAPGAIASLKSAVLSLFTGSDDSNNGGNTPVNPAPQQGASGEVVVAIAPLEEPLAGQMCELTSPSYHPPADAAHVESDTACTVDTPEPEPEQLSYVELIPVTHLVAYQRRRVDGEIICCYLAGNNKSRLQDWGSWLCNQHSVGSGFELREAVRLTAYKHEIKIWGMSFKQIQRLAETDTTKTPPSRYHVASIPVAANLLQEDAAPSDVKEVSDRNAETEQESAPEAQSFQVGAMVKITSDRHGVELLGQTGVVTAGTAAGAAVDVGGTLRWFCSDELAISKTPESPASLEPTEAEKIALDSIQPPVPASTLAYNPNPMGRGGAVANWKARTLGGIGVDLKNCGTGGITSLAEWQRIEAEQKALAATASTTDDEPDF